MISVKPLKSESIFSILTRAHIALGSLSPLDTLRSITGKRGYKPLSGLPTELGKIRASLRIDPSVDELISEHTHYNFFLPFIPPERREYIRSAMIWSGSVKSRLGILKSHCGAAEKLSYCTNCAIADINRYGFAYWHNEHMINGMTFCPIHQVNLVSTLPVDSKFQERNLFLP
jgi:hypothetical protein